MNSDPTFVEGAVEKLTAQRSVAHPSAVDVGRISPLQPISDSYKVTPGGIFVDSKLMEDATPFKIGEKVPFKGWMFMITDINAGSITLQAVGRTGQYKRAAAGKEKYQKSRGSNRMKPRKKRK